MGAVLRSVRIRRELRQVDVAGMAGLSRATVSRMERGHFASLSIEAARRVAAVLDIRLDLVPRWRGGDLDRLLNSRHGRLHELVARRLVHLDGWVVAPEVSFAIYSERGVVDILAFHEGRGIVLVIELKTEIVDVNELVGTLDRKRRLAIDIAHSHGWAVPVEARAAAWLIVAESRTNRRRLSAHRTMLRAAFPSDGRRLPGWLRDPVDPIRALSFWPNDHPGNVGASLASVRRVRSRTGPRRSRAVRSERAGGTTGAGRARRASEPNVPGMRI